MNFIEALKANETEEVMIEGSLIMTYNVGGLKYSDNSVYFMMEQKFKIVKTPKVVEFDCNWTELNSSVYPVEEIGGPNLYVKLKSMIGKRWRVRCEEIL